MADKKAFVFDTNFIIQHKDLDKTLDKLKEHFSVYVTQVSIDERIAQTCREVRATFDDAEKCRTKFIHIATIEFKKSYEEECDYIKKRMQSSYEEYFGKSIIPFRKDGQMLSAIIERANNRTPPFLSVKDASDKGFKDCLLWLSILEYFKKNGEKEIIFMTDDKSAFGNNKEALKDEFYKITGKQIEIYPNSYYKELLKQDDPTEQQASDDNKVNPIELPNIDAFRTEIEEAIDALRYAEYENNFGDLQWFRTFSTSILFDKEYMKTVFSKLQDIIILHILETAVPATAIFDLDDRVYDAEAEIPINKLEKALNVYRRMLNNYPQYSEQFFEAAAKILNRSYYSPKSFVVADDDLPF